MAGATKPELNDLSKKLVSERSQQSAWLETLQRRLKAIASARSALDMGLVRELTTRLLVYRMSEDDNDPMIPLRYCQELARISGWYLEKGAKKEPDGSLGADEAKEWQEEVKKLRASKTG